MPAAAKTGQPDPAPIAPPPTLPAAMAELQRRLPRIGKDKRAVVTSQRTGKTHSYGYADLAAVSAAVLPLCGELGLAFVATPTLRDDRLVLAYELMHVSGDSISGTLPLRGGTPQEIGSEITYFRRYALTCVTGVAAEEDDDDGHAAETGARAEPPGPRKTGRLPRNRDGSISRSRVTDDELDAAGAMTTAQAAEHRQLQDGAARGKVDGTFRLDGTPTDDPFYDPQTAKPAVRTPRPAGNIAGVIVRHFERLEVTDRTERLDFTAALAGRAEPIASTSDLTAGQAVEVKNKLERCRDRGALIALLADSAVAGTAEPATT